MKNKNKNKNRFQETFKNISKNNKIAFIPFWVLGYPTIEKSEEIIEKLAENSDILELGMPFSDPGADGPVIEKADKIALENGISVEKSFNIIFKIRKKFPQKPIGLLMYFNLILAFGIENFFKKCSEIGVDSILIPEVPVGDIEKKIRSSFLTEKVSLMEMSQKYNIDLIYLISTNTEKDKREEIYKNSNSFIYGVSKPGVTGVSENVELKTEDMIRKIKSETKVPICIGFGVSKPEHVKILKRNGADGAIVGSKLFKIFEEDGVSGIEKFCKECQKET